MFNLADLQQLIAARYVAVQKHPTASLFIYNYTAQTQYNNVWNEITLQCRGLILDENGHIVARPFPKFFNLGEQANQVIPNENFEVYEKLDGSLGILYWLDNKPFIATRGSFQSEQSQKANELLNTKYAHTIVQLNPQYTYLFEIIYPENRIVVNYGTEEMLVLLAVIDKISGAELPLPDIGFPVVKRYDGIKDISELADKEEDNREGFVVRFSGGLRYKIKFKEYVRIHRIVSQVSNISIWEYLAAGKVLGELLDRVPDEFYQWVKHTHAQLLADFARIETEAKAEFKVLETRKETALYFCQCRHTSVLFAMLDARDYAPIIWKQLRPHFSKPFANFEAN